MTDLYPLKFKPVYKDYPWGNNRLPALFGREAPEGIYAESWEVSTHPDGESVVSNGRFKGQLFSDVIRAHRDAILGSAVEGDDFPLLIKLLDSAHPLSVQVHPSNENAESVQGEAKTEMWYFLNRKPAKVCCGLVPGTTRECFISAVETGDVADVLRSDVVKRGDTAFVPGGRVHSIDAGCLILEIQQNSNTTYRVYDWGRMGNDGKPRELHLEKALQVIDFNDTDEPVTCAQSSSKAVRNVRTTDFFTLDELQVDREFVTCTDGSGFHILFSAEGSFDIAYGDDLVEPVAMGTSVLIPAGMGGYVIRSAEKMLVLKVSLPSASRVLGEEVVKF